MRTALVNNREKKIQEINHGIAIVAKIMLTQKNQKAAIVYNYLKNKKDELLKSEPTMIGLDELKKAMENI